jgi:RNA-directed DNA polymerase
MASQEFVARCLSAALVSGQWTIEELVVRGEDVLGKRWRWLRPLAQRLTQAFPDSNRPRYLQVKGFLLSDVGFRRTCRKHNIAISIATRRPAMVPWIGSPSSWDVPPIVTPGELADWLGLRLGELDWLADRHRLGQAHWRGPFQHYQYYWLSKRLAGTARLIEAPKWRLKTVQKRILHGILDNVPPHATAHGFRSGRSIKTFAAPHVGHAIVIRMDLQDFFPSIARARVAGVFRVAGYPEDVAQLLASFCTNSVPEEVWRTFPEYGGARDRLRHESLYGQPHLPQGAPTSPALANLSAFRLDCRLDGLARSVGAQYTRYADDLLFSGNDQLARASRRFPTSVGAIAIEQGFQVNLHKTRVMSQGRRQHAAGLVVNQSLNTPRDEFDRLKAILFNCTRNGPAVENRQAVPDFRAHLEGRVTHIESINPRRGRRLRDLLKAIEWPEEA